MRKTIVCILLALFLSSCSRPRLLPVPALVPTATKPAPSAPSASAPIATLPALSAPSASFDKSNLGTVARDIIYCTMDGVPLKMDIYYPKQADAVWPVVMYVHGGAWEKGSKSEADMTEQPALTAAGFLFVSIDYRLAPEYKFPAMIEDTKCAVRYLRAHAAGYNLDPNRVGAIGGSDGGHLVSLLGLSDQSAGWEVGEYLNQSSRVQAVVDYFGPADLTVVRQNNLITGRLWKAVFGATSGSDPLMAAASPVTYVTSDDPPFLIVQGEQDTLVSPAQSQELYDRLTSTGIPAQLVMVKNSEHAFAPSGGSLDPSRASITQMAVDFFTKYLK